MKAYIIGYDPPGVDLEELRRSGWVERTIRACDFCVVAERGLHVGQVLVCEYGSLHVERVSHHGKVAHFRKAARA